MTTSSRAACNKGFAGCVKPIGMSKKNIAMFVVLIVLAVLYVFYFTNIFENPRMEITSKIRPVYSRKTGKTTKQAPANLVSFSLNNKYEMTSIKVVEESDFKTNKYPHALWHLVSKSNSVPTKTIIYGLPIGGMESKIAKVKPEKLQTNVPYVLLLEAGKIKGQTTFQIR